MAGNHGCPDCQKKYGQPGNGGSDQEGSILQRTRTASPENGRASPTIVNPYYTGRPRTPANGNKGNTIDRQEIIRRIKSGGSRPTSPELEKSTSVDAQELIRRIKRGDFSRPTSPELERSTSSELSRKRKSPIPQAAAQSEASARPRSPEGQPDNQTVGSQIERPRSALHRGDFREREQNARPRGNFDGSGREDVIPPLSTSPIAPWHLRFPSAAAFRTPFQDEPRPQPSVHDDLQSLARRNRDRAVSNVSLAASFVYKPPTSPLVQSSRPDTPEPLAHPLSRSPDKSSRRHTFSPPSLRHFQSALEYPTAARANERQAPSLRSEKTFPYQAHQPRRSLNSTSFSSLPQSPTSALRRPSFSTDTPLQRAPMVGSYEESILRGRMSTIPSRPLNFMAQIGVLGKGNCKSSLRCPPHVSVPFPAVFYSYGTGVKNPANDQPSPYVGLVDLENNLASQEESHDKRLQKLQSSRSSEGSRASSPKGIREDASTSDAQNRRRRRQKGKRRSGSPKAPPGGSYRIPQQGQLQIVIKNPNKTAVKLFLVPYDLSDMEPGQKTFIRQRSYSAGPIVDMPLASRPNLGTDRPEASINATGDPHDRPMLRYLIHLHICCPSKGRFFLYKSVRVVFANRVPDGKEKLRNEIQLPEPRYSTYKVGRDSNVGNTSSTMAKDPNRRRSAIEQHHSVRTSWFPASYDAAQSLPTHDYSSRHGFALSTLPRQYTALPTLESRPASRQFSDYMEVDSGAQDMASMRSPASSAGVTPQQQEGLPRLEDPFLTFERDRSRERRTGPRSESLLSRRLMDLAFQNQTTGSYEKEL